jgi:pimeloyl-ACP methyl ester carboxylesterase
MDGPVPMKRASATIAVVVLLPVAVFVAFPALRYVTADRETLTIDDDARRKAPNGKFIQLSQGVTHYELGGPDGGRTVLLIDGFSTPYNIWDPTFNGLTKAGFRVLRYDLYGRGFSDRPVAPYDGNFFDRQALDLIDTLGIQQVDVGGLSMGGPIAVTFAVRHPDRVRKVMLFDPGYFTGNRGPLALRAPMLGEYNMAVTIAPGLAQSQWKDFAHPERYPHYLDEYREQMRYKGFRRSLLQTLRNYVSTNVTDDFSALGKSRKSVLLIWGRADKDTPLELSDTVRAAVPQAEFHVVEDAAHVPHYEHPEIVNPIVIEFLSHD